MRKVKEKKKINEHARALFARAGTASVAIAVDTRPRRVPPKNAYVRKPKHRALQEGCYWWPKYILTPMLHTWNDDEGISSDVTILAWALFPNDPDQA